jgi:hypothetical protein
MNYTPEERKIVDQSLANLGIQNPHLLTEDEVTQVFRIVQNAQAAPQQESSSLSSTIKNVAKGAAAAPFDLVNLPFQAANLASNLGQSAGNYVAEKMGLPAQQAPQMPINTLAENVNSKIQNAKTALGINAPSSDNTADYFAYTLGNLASPIPLSSAAKLNPTSLAKQFGRNIGDLGTFGGATAATATANEDSPWAQPIATLAGMVAGKAGQNWLQANPYDLSRTIKEIAEEDLQKAREVQKTAANFGIDITPSEAVKAATKGGTNLATIEDTLLTRPSTTKTITERYKDRPEQVKAGYEKLLGSFTQNPLDAATQKAELSKVGENLFKASPEGARQAQISQLFEKNFPTLPPDVKGKELQSPVRDYIKSGEDAFRQESNAAYDAFRKDQPLDLGILASDPNYRAALERLQYSAQPTDFPWFQNADVPQTQLSSSSSLDDLKNLFQRVSEGGGDIPFSGVDQPQRIPTNAGIFAALKEMEKAAANRSLPPDIQFGNRQSAENLRSHLTQNNPNFANASNQYFAGKSLLEQQVEPFKRVTGANDYGVELTPPERAFSEAAKVGSTAFDAAPPTIQNLIAYDKAKELIGGALSDTYAGYSDLNVPRLEQGVQELPSTQQGLVEKIANLFNPIRTPQEIDPNISVLQRGQNPLKASETLPSNTESIVNAIRSQNAELLPSILREQMPPTVGSYNEMMKKANYQQNLEDLLSQGGMQNTIDQLNEFNTFSPFIKQNIAEAKYLSNLSKDLDSRSPFLANPTQGNAFRSVWDWFARSDPKARNAARILGSFDALDQLRSQRQYSDLVKQYFATQGANAVTENSGTNPNQSLVIDIYP